MKIDLLVMPGASSAIESFQRNKYYSSMIVFFFLNITMRILHMDLAFD